MDKPKQDYKEALDKAYKKAVDLFQLPESAWTPMEVKNELTMGYIDDPTTGSRVLKIYGIVADAEPEMLAKDVFGQTFEDKKALGQDFLVKVSHVSSLTPKAFLINSFL